MEKALIVGRDRTRRALGCMLIDIPQCCHCWRRLSGRLRIKFSRELIETLSNITKRPGRIEE